MISNSFLRASLAALGVAIAAASPGCFVTWRRMANFGDATAHASILEVAMALSFSTSVFVGVLAVSLGIATILTMLSGHGYTINKLLGMTVHSARVFGLLSVTLLESVRIDLMAYLFGHILAVDKTDLAVIWAGSALVVGLVAWRWSALLTATLSPELAYARGNDPK